jgi:CheY-like chemotaxis protein
MNDSQKIEHIQVLLLVEDSKADIRLMIESLREHSAAGALVVIEDGEQAMALLRREGEYIRSPRPDMILLDLNLPRKSGMEVLEEVKSDPKLRRIPVVVVSSSEAEKDIIGAYDLGANAYLTKPIDLDDFMAMVRSLVSFWLTFAKLPRR